MGARLWAEHGRPESVVFSKTAGRRQPLRVGDEFVVRVVDTTDVSFRLATLAGHLEAGQVEFRARAEGPALRFTVEMWNRCAGRLVELLYARLRLAKEIRGGVRVTTRWLDEAHGLHDACSRERAGS